MAFEGPGIGIV